MTDREIHQKLDKIIQQLTRIETLLIIEGEITMSAIDDLTTQVAANTSAEKSAVTLIQGIAAQLAAAGTDPAKLTALQSQLKASADALAAAVVANTPSSTA